MATKTVIFKCELGQKVKTPFNDTGIIGMCAVDDGGVKYWVQTALGGQWFLEHQLVTEGSFSTMETKS